MATYVVGDIHGCYLTFRCLLEEGAFDRRKDRLWLVGDLVNRGPSSLQVLRWVRDLEREIGERCVVVLGNHDIHLLAQHAGLVAPRRQNSFAQLLAAPDADRLCAWLRARPLLHRAGPLLLVHAGILPSWSVQDVELRARSVEGRLARGHGLEELLGSGAADAELADQRRTLAVLTRLRTCTASGELCPFSGPPEQAPDGCLPWFRVPGRRTVGETVIFGHWAALGLCQEPGVWGLDSGCSWGASLSALVWEEEVSWSDVWEKGRIIQQSVEPAEAPD